MIDIAGYKGLYAITEDGKVWSYRKNIFLKPFLARGYFKVRLYKDENNKQFLIHRLVAEAFYKIRKIYRKSIIKMKTN